MLASEPTDSTQASEAAEPMDRIDPAEPMDKIDPDEPMDRIDPAEPIDKIEPDEPMLRIDPDEPAALGAEPSLMAIRPLCRVARAHVGCGCRHGDARVSRRLTLPARPPAARRGPIAWGHAGNRGSRHGPFGQKRGYQYERDGSGLTGPGH